MVLTGPGPGPSQIVQDARLAFQQGRRVFVARISADIGKASTGTSLPLVANLIETVEAEGWRLDQMANTVFGRGFDYENIACLFRRVD